jgi:DNA-binding YbaB/EbfC family protein
MKNMQQFFKQAQQLQEQLEKAQKEMEAKEVMGASGAGLVSVTMNLKGVVKSISIDKSIVNQDEIEILEDLVVAAVNDAKNKADRMVEERIKEASGGADLSHFRGLM